MDRTNEVEVVVITGMSGAGKSVAMQSFEDLGFFCIDNLPPELMPTFLELMMKSENKMRRIAAVMDTRGGDLFHSITQALDQISSLEHVKTTVLFLEASDETLVSRYKETRRNHPLSNSGTILEGIHRERLALSEIKGHAKMIVNTSGMKPKALREQLMSAFSTQEKEPFRVHFTSFGFKHGMPIDADVVFDVRFLPNPFYIEELRPKTGNDKEVYDYVLKWNDTQLLIEKLTDLFQFIIPQYKNEGKAQAVIAFGCTGGQHRSVTLANYFSDYFKDDFTVMLSHRDIDKKGK